jgi:hypothetical protein
MKDTLKTLDEMLGIVVKYALPLPSLKHLSCPFRLQPFFLFIAPVPISRRLCAFARRWHRFCTVDPPYTAPSFALELNFDFAVRGFLEAEKQAGRSGSEQLDAYLRQVDQSLRAQRAEEDLHFVIVRLLFSRQQRKVFVDQKRLK